MNQLLSTKHINNLKASAIRSGGFVKNKELIIEACKEHLELYGVDLTPEALEQIRPRVTELIGLGMLYEQACNKAIQEKILVYKTLIKTDLTKQAYKTTLIGVHKV